MNLDRDNPRFRTLIDELVDVTQTQASALANFRLLLLAGVSSDRLAPHLATARAAAHQIVSLEKEFAEFFRDASPK